MLGTQSCARGMLVVFRSLITFFYLIHSSIFYSSSENLPGAIPVQIVSSIQKDRPAGTSWILPGGSSVDVSTAKTENQLDDEKGMSLLCLFMCLPIY